MTSTAIREHTIRRARQQFLYWTWTFDAFLKDTEQMQREAKAK